MTKAELIAEIIASVYTNARGEITGANLQRTLLDIVGYLGDAATKGVGIIQDGDEGLVSGDSVYEALQELLNSLGEAAGFDVAQAVADGDLSHLVTGDAVFDAISSALQDYVPKTRKVNNKPLSSDITLSLDDVPDGATRKLTDFFELDTTHTFASGKQAIKLKDTYEGLWSPGFVSAGGMSDGSGSEGTTLEAVWQSLTNGSSPVTPTSTTKINAYHIPIGDGLSIDSNGNIKVDAVGGVSSVAGLTGAISKADLQTALELGDLAYKDSLAESDIPTLAISKISGLQTALDNKQPLDTDLTAIAALTGAGLLKRNSDNTWGLDTNSYITGINASMVNAALGFTLTGTADTTYNLATISSYASHGESAYTSLNDWFEIVDGNIHVKNNRGFYSDSFISAGGLSSGGGSEGVNLEAVWASLQNNDIGDYNNRKIHENHLPTISGTGITGTYSHTGTGENISTNLALSVNVATILGYTPVNPASLGAAAGYGVASSISAGSTSTNLPTSAAVASFVENKGYAKTAQANDFVFASNEWGVIPSGYSGGLWLNYRTASGATDGNLTSYYMGNGMGGLATVTASGFIKSGGTYSQFLKADGSVDSSAYITGINYTMVTNALGYTPYNAANISSASVNYANSAGNSSALGGIASANYYHTGNSNKGEVAWACSNLEASGVVRAHGFKTLGNGYAFAVANGDGIEIWWTGNRAIFQSYGRGTSNELQGLEYNASFHFFNDGNVGFGTSSPAYKVDVVGVIHASTGIFSDGYVTAGSASDARLKDNVQNLSLEYARNIIMSSRPITFQWNALAHSLCDKYEGDGIGFIAQEAEQLMPFAVSPIFEKYKRLDYTKFIAPLVCVAQDHERRIAELERENRELKARLQREYNVN